MDRERLLGNGLRHENKAVKKRDKAAARAAIRAARQAELEQAQEKAHNERQAAFTELDDRNTAVITKAGDFTKSGVVWRPTRRKNSNEPKIKKQGHIVVLEAAPQTDATPDHVVVALVSTVESRSHYEEDESNDPDNTRVQFRFTYIPRGQLERVVAATDGQYPLDLVSDDERALTTMDEETYFSSKYDHTNRLKKLGSDLNWNGYGTRKQEKAYRQGLANASLIVDTMEHNLNWVLEAAANPDLNPHLQETMASMQSAERRPVPVLDVDF